MRWAPLLPALALAAALSSCGLLLPSGEPEVGKALLIGISRYIDPDINDLQVADDDALDMAATLEGRGWETELLLNESATRSEILRRVAEVGAAAGKRRRVLVYYSGHGDRNMLLPADYDRQNSADSSVTSADLASVLAGVESTRVILIIDACYSGTFVGTGRSVDPTPPNSGLHDEGLERTMFEFSASELAELAARSAKEGGEYRGPLVLSAAGAGELSWEITGSNGIFTSFLLKAAERGDRDGDGRVSVLEAFAYAKAGVELYWNSASGRFFDVGSGTYADYSPRASGGIQDFVLFN